MCPWPVLLPPAILLQICRRLMLPVWCRTCVLAAPHALTHGAAAGDTGKPRRDLSHGAWSHCFSVLLLSAWPFVPQCGPHSSGDSGQGGWASASDAQDSLPSPRSPETLFPLGHRFELFLVHCSGHASCHRRHSRCAWASAACVPPCLPGLGFLRPSSSQVSCPPAHSLL